MTSSQLTALITGASSGIGYELTKLCAADGYRVILVARNSGALKTFAKELEKTFGVETLVIAANLADPASVPMIANKVKQADWQVDILINNAGFGGYGRFDQTEWKHERDMVTVNVESLIHLTKVFLPQMVDRGFGHILNLASLAAFMPGPYMSIYYATKSFVLSFSQALAEELKETGVTVTALCPGPTKTKFAKVAGMSQNPLFENASPEVIRVAKAGYEGMKMGKRIVIPGWFNSVRIWGLRLLPSSVVTSLVARLQK